MKQTVTAVLLTAAIVVSGCRSGAAGPDSLVLRAAGREAPEFSARNHSQNPETAVRGQAADTSPENAVVQAAYQESAYQEGTGAQPGFPVDSSVLETESRAIEQPAFETEAGTYSPLLTLDELLQSVVNCYPEIDIAVGEIETAQGKTLESMGQFDDVFSAHSISQPLGFYQTYRNGTGITRPLYGGGEVYGTYRIGDGNFEPWFGERETNEGGEFKAGFSLPLLKDRNIDKRRAVLLTAIARQDQTGAEVNARLLQLERLATQSYWQWVAAGRAVLIQRRLLELAETRVDQIRRRIAAGELADIDQIDNDRFIAKRKNDLIKAERELEKAAIKMSLFYRDAACSPQIAGDDRLPVQFPGSQFLEQGRVFADIENAIAVRPELAALSAEREQACISLELGRNDTLPRIDLKGFAGQDVGGAASPTGDKTPFELQLGVLAEVPIQRRGGQGRMEAARGKLRQLDAKIRLVSDKIRAEIQDAASAVNAAAAQVEQSAENVRLASQSLSMGRVLFEEGDVDLIELNIYEASVVDAELQLLDAKFKYFSSLVRYETAASGQPFVTRQ
ncbi:MAG: TolC family protein [Planctomycetota bacterium]